MGHERYLLELLRPLGVYDLRARAVNRGELGVYGVGLDEGLSQLEETAREMCLMTAEGAGLERVEELLPYRPRRRCDRAPPGTGRPAADRRRQLHSGCHQRHAGRLRHQRCGN